MRLDRDDHSDVDSDISKPHRPRRVEVLSGPERRRKWPDERKIAIVAETLEPGIVVSDVARRHDLSPSQLFGWLKQFRNEAQALLDAKCPPERPVFAPAVTQSGGVRTDAVQSHSLSGEEFLLARTLQSELQRVGCYDREINGIWTTSSRMAMQMFLERVNAALPFDEPNEILLSLVQAHNGAACRKPCPVGQTHTKSCPSERLVAAKFKPQDDAPATLNPLVTGSLVANASPQPAPQSAPAPMRAPANVRTTATAPPDCAQDFTKLPARHGTARFALKRRRPSSCPMLTEPASAGLSRLFGACSWQGSSTGWLSLALL